VVKPRRVPRADSATVVDRVVAAAHALLAEDGYDAMSTNRIAQRAGISIGSLYHYFPTKEAIVAELARRLETRGLEIATGLLVRGGATPMPELVRALVEILRSPDIGLVPVRRTLLARVPPRWFAEHSMAVDREVRAWTAAAMRARAGAELRDGPADVMAFVAYHAVEGAVEALIAEHPERAVDETYFAELVRLLVTYVDRQA
jgi:AcrR family transcriptional regulator